MFSALKLSALLALVPAVSSSLPCNLPHPGRQEHRFAREGVLGTSALLTLHAEREASAVRAAEALFAQVAVLEAQLSTWRSDSELSKLCRGEAQTASEPVTAVLQAGETWQARTHGAIAPGIASAANLWRDAVNSGFPPTAKALADAAALAKAVPWQRQGEQWHFTAPITLDAFAKGWIVDRAVRVLAEHAGVQFVSFQIGGDMLVGETEQQVALIDPRQPAENATPLAKVRLRNLAVASSGGYARPMEVGIRHHSHILNPATGEPCDDALGASVIADNAETADALATALCVLGAQAGMELLESFASAAGVLVTRDGKVHESKRFRALCVAQPANAPAASPWAAGFDVEIQFDIVAPASTGSSRRGGWKRPYVAVWVEDAAETPARTLCLWMEKPRWLRDLRRWSRQHESEPELSDLLSQATRKAGHYTLRWDGKDDSGRVLTPGKYTIYLEAAREHGTYQIAKATLDLRNKPEHAKLADNAELANMTIDFGRHTR